MKRGYVKIDSDDLSEHINYESRLFDRMKNAIFVTYFEILETKHLSENMGILLIVISFVQLISMSFNENNNDLESSFISSLLVLPNYVLLYPAVLQASDPLFNIIILICLMMLLVFLFVSIFYLAQKDNHNDPFVKQFKNTWGFLSELTDKILVVPIVGLTVGNISCGYSNSQLQCFSGIHIVVIILCVINITLLAILEILYTYLFFNFTFKIKDSYSRNPSAMNILFLICRIIITIFQSKLDQSQYLNYLTIVVMHLLFGLILTYDSLNSFPYHNKNVSKANGIFSASYLWINLSFTILLISSIDMMHQNALIIVGLGLVFFVKLFLNIRNYYVKVLMNNELEDISNDVLLDLKLRTYNNLAKTLDFKKSELLLASLLKIHYDKCQNQEDCPCRRRNSILDPKKNYYGDNNIQFHKDQVFVKHFIARMVRDGLNKFKDSKLLYLDLIFYRFEALRIYASIYFEIMKFEEKFHNDMSLAIEFCLYRLGAKLKQYLQGRNKKVQVAEALNIEDVRQFDQGIIKLKDNIVTVNRNFNDLWESLQDLVPDLSKILDIGNKSINNIQITNQLYEDLIKLNNQSQDLKNIMDIYTNHIIFDELLQFKVQKDIFMPNIMEIDNSLQVDLDMMLKRYNIFDENTCVLTISPKLENLGQIQWCSRNVSNIFGYDETDLLNLNVNELMPGPISISHNRILRYYYENGRERLTKTITHIWALDAEKYCFSANIFIKIIPSLKSFDIMGFIHKLNQEDYLIADVDGMLYGVGRKISQLIDLKPNIVCETNFNIQLLAPKLMIVFRQYFIDFDDVSLTNDQKDIKVMIPPEDVKIEELKFFLFIPNNLEEKVRSFADVRQATFNKFGVDLQTKEKYVAQDLFTKEKVNVQNNTIKQLIKQALEFKSSYAELLHRMNRKIQTKQLKKIIRVKAQIKNFTFWNGVRYQTLKIIKFNSYDIKKHDYLQKNHKKVKNHENFVLNFIMELKKEHQDFKTKKMNMTVVVEEDNADDQELQALGQRDNEASGVVPNQIKGIMNIFKKSNINKPVKGSIFQKINKFGTMLKQNSFQGGPAVAGENPEQQQNKLKGAILMTLFKPGMKKVLPQNIPKKGLYNQSSKRDSSNALIDPDAIGVQNIISLEYDDDKKKVDVSQEQMNKIQQCVVIPRIVKALQKAKLIGLSEFSVFYDKEAALLIKKMPLRGIARLRNIINGPKFKTYVESQQKNTHHDPKHHGHNKHDSDSSDMEEDQDQKQRSEKSEDENDEERNILQFLERKEVKEEERAVQQSIGSTSSLQTHNALRLLRESLKQMKAPQILITANYLIILICLLIVTLTIVQYLYIQNDFEGVKEELYMYQRVSHYSEAISEIFDGYQTFAMINTQTLSNQTYNQIWQTDYKQQLIVTWADLVEFFLSDFSQDGRKSYSGNDLRAYLFQVLNTSTLINDYNDEVEINFETYVRLFTNAVNQTIQLPNYDFSVQPKDNVGLFYFIYQNFESLFAISDANFQMSNQYIQKSLQQLQSRFLFFWTFGFIVILLCYIFIYPIILRTKITIHETLRIFTKISMRDVDHYAEHYKKIFFMLKSVQDSSELIQKVDDEILLLKQQYIKQKAHDSRALSRSRNYKGIKINKVLFFIVMTLWLLIFSTIILMKDFFIIEFISNSYELNDIHRQLYKMKYTYETNFIKYKQAYQTYILNGTIDTNELQKLSNSLSESDTEVIIVQNLQVFSQYSVQYGQFIKNLITQDLCQQVFLNGSQYNYSLSLNVCQNLGNKILQKGILNFYLTLEHDMLNGINLLVDLSKGQKNEVFMFVYYLQGIQDAKQEIQDIKYRDYVDGFLYAKLYALMWQNIEQEAFFMGIDQQIQYNQYFVIALSLLTFLFLVLIWFREYNELKTSSKWVNGFILLIPINILKENQYIRTFLKKKLNLQSLMYI